MAIVEQTLREILDLKNKVIKVRSSPDSYNRRDMWAGGKKKSIKLKIDQWENE